MGNRGQRDSNILLLEATVALIYTLFYLWLPEEFSDALVTPAVRVKRIASSMFISRGRTELRGTSTA